MKVNRDLVLQVTTVIVAVVLIGFFVHSINVSFVEADRLQKARMIASSSLSRQEDIIYDDYGITFSSEFTKSERVNTVIVTYPDYYGNSLTVSKKDYNKSLIVGEYVGEKTKTAAKGFIRGIFKKNTKHED